MAELSRRDGETDIRFRHKPCAGDPKAGVGPQPVLVLHMEGGQIVSHIALDQVPQWAKPVVAAAFDATRKKATKGRPH